MVKLTKQKERMQFQPKLQLFQVALSNSPTTVIVKLFKNFQKQKKNSFQNNFYETELYECKN